MVRKIPKARKPEHDQWMFHAAVWVIAIIIMFAAECMVWHHFDHHWSLFARSKVMVAIMADQKARRVFYWGFAILILNLVSIPIIYFCREFVRRSTGESEW